MRIQPGDPDKQSLKDRGLTWEMILQAIESGGLLDVLTDTAHPGQVVLAVDIAGYVHAVPCLAMARAFCTELLKALGIQATPQAS